MNRLNEKEYQSLKTLINCNQRTLLKYLKHFLSNNYKDVISTKEFLIAKGTIPIALVAHLDTVFENVQIEKELFYDEKRNVCFCPDGPGFDDKAGVYSIVQLIKRGYKPSIIFTTDEELGCKGADALVKTFPQAPMDVKYIVELDRRGSVDCVFYQCNNPVFEEYVESFGFVMNFGSFSDISVICPYWGIAGVNLSIGYYDEHSYTETLYVGQMFATINKVEEMLKAANEAPIFEYKEIENQNWMKNYIQSSAAEDAYGWDPSFGIKKEDWDMLMEPQSTCKDCGQWDYNYNLFPVKVSKGNEKITLCSDCLSRRDDIYWCNTCGEPFINEENKEEEAIYYCENCRGKTENGSKNN